MYLKFSSAYQCSTEQVSEKSVDETQSHLIDAIAPSAILVPVYDFGCHVNHPQKDVRRRHVHRPGVVFAQEFDVIAGVVGSGAGPGVDGRIAAGLPVAAQLSAFCECGRVGQDTRIKHFVQRDVEKFLF